MLQPSNIFLDPSAAPPSSASAFAAPLADSAGSPSCGVGTQAPHLYIGDFGLSREHFVPLAAADADGDAPPEGDVDGDGDAHGDGACSGECERSESAKVHRLTGEVGTPPYSAPEVRAGALYSFSVRCPFFSASTTSGHLHFCSTHSDKLYGSHNNA